MKLTIVMMITCLQLNAEGFSQTINLSGKNMPLEEVFKAIEKQSGYFFFYKYKDLQQAGRVSVNVHNATLEEALKVSLEDKSLKYILEDKNIIITRQDKNEIKMPAIDVKGKVTDADGSPLPGATVRVKGSNIAVSANADGEFSLRGIENDATLVVSYTGFVTQELRVPASGILNVKLKESLQELGAVVVVGYGTVKKVNLTGSLSVVDMTTREDRPLTNASQALQGTPGVWINQAGSQPGKDAASVKIRGITSLGASGKNDPLVLVDGIEYPLNEINPDFIETITVLKDASAAIYGSRAANGVILVTTKSGKKGKTEVNYNFNYGTQQATILPDVIWDPIQYMKLKDQALLNEGKTVVDYTPAQILEYQNGMATNPYAYPNINWYDLVLKNGYLQQHNVRVSGGSDKIVYNIGLGYMDQDGILIEKNHANAYTLNASISANLTEKLRVGTSIISNYRNYTEPALNGNTAGEGTATNYYFNRLTRVLPIFTPYTQDGRYGSVVFATPGRNTIENPIMLIKEGSNVRTPQRMLAKIFADYDLPFNLKYNINLGLDRSDSYAAVFSPYIVSYHPITGAPNNYNIIPKSYRYNDNQINLAFFQTLTWNKVFAEKHNVSAMAGTSYNNNYDNYFSAQVEGYFDNSLTDISAGSSNPTNNGIKSKDILESYFGRVNYTFNNKYIIEGVVRYDGSSKFGTGNKWGAFPSASAAWRIDQENFFKNIRGVDQLKLRASWGKLGNQAVANYSYDKSVRLGQDYSFNNILSPGAAVLADADPNISWETTTTSDVGLDFEAWKGMLGITFDVFKRRTSNILRPVALSAQVGNLTGPTKNIGIVDNDGFDLNFSHRNTINKFTYAISGGVSFVKNKVVDINGETIISGKRIIKEGFPIDSYYIFQADGIYQNQAEIDNSPHLAGVRPGYLRYKDINSDGKIDGNDRVITGKSQPDYSYNFDVSIGYKNLSLNSFFQGVQGVDQYPTANYASPFNNGAGVTKEWATDAWTPENPGARLPIVTTATGAPEMYGASNASSFWLLNGSYLRIKSVQLKYDVSKRWISKISLNKLALFINAENPAIFTKFSGFDPEKDIKGDTFYEYPTLKTYSFGLNATF